jgi:ketosteroid isomerase-like protein
MNSGSVEDRLAIRELTEAFAVASTRKNQAGWAATLTEDALFQLPSMSEPAKGPKAIIETLLQKMDYTKFMNMLAFPTEVVVEGDTARCKTYCREFIFPKVGGQKFVVGCFDDKLVKHDGQWRFAARIYEIVAMEDL